MHLVDPFLPHVDTESHSVLVRVHSIRHHWIASWSALLPSAVEAMPSIVIGLMYYKIDDSLNFGTTDRYSSQFFILAAMMFIPPFAAVTLWDTERKLLKVETNRKSYSIFCYFLAKTGTTWPMEIFLSLTLSLICYWMIGKAVSYTVFYKREMFRLQAIKLVLTSS